MTIIQATHGYVLHSIYWASGESTDPDTLAIESWPIIGWRIASDPEAAPEPIVPCFGADPIEQHGLTQMVFIQFPDGRLSLWNEPEPVKDFAEARRETMVLLASAASRKLP